MERWFTSDSHYGQEAVIRLQPRPYASLSDMEEDLVHRWNEVIKPHDIVYHLGDFATGSAADKPRIQGIFKRLNGEKMLIRGNHDVRNVFVQRLGWKFIGDLKTISVDGIKIAMCHYPLQAWDGSMDGSWHLHGHTHGLMAEHHTWLKEDVSADRHGLRPISLDEVKDIMSKRKFVAPDKRTVYYEEDFERWANEKAGGR